MNRKRNRAVTYSVESGQQMTLSERVEMFGKRVSDFQILSHESYAVCPNCIQRIHKNTLEIFFESFMELIFCSDFEPKCFSMNNLEFSKLLFENILLRILGF